MSENRLSLKANADLDLIAKEVPSQRVLELVVHAPQMVENKNRPNLNLALIIDRSGSMGGDKLKYVKEAAFHVLDLLQEQDQVSIVCYDDQVDTLASNVKVTSAARQNLRNLIKCLNPGGQTNLSDGWLRGCEHVATAIHAENLSRVLLLTDGLANVGITDLEELGHHAREIHSRGVSTSTFGVGEGYNEHLLEQMANQGGGNFHFIDSPMLIPQIFIQELKDLSSVTARDVEVLIEIPPHVDAHVMAGWKQTIEENKLRISIGDLVSNQEREVYIKLLFPPQNQDTAIKFGAKVICKDEGGQVMEDQVEISFQYVEKTRMAAAPLKEEVMQRFSVVEVADSANEALKLERKGEFQKAGNLLAEAVIASAPYMASDKLEQYQGLSRRMMRGLDERDRKSSHYTQYTDKQRRNR